MSKPTPIRILLESVIRAQGWNERMELHQVFHFWDELLGPDIARQAQPQVIRQTVLWVRVSDSVWMQQLHLLKEMVLEKINHRLKKSKFTDLRFQLDSSLGVAAGRRAKQAARRRHTAPSPEQKRDFEHLLDTIPDEGLKAAIRKCWLKTGQLRRAPEEDCPLA